MRAVRQGTATAKAKSADMVTAAAPSPTPRDASRSLGGAYRQYPWEFRAGALVVSVFVLAFMLSVSRDAAEVSFLPGSNSFDQPVADVADDREIADDNGSFDSFARLAADVLAREAPPVEVTVNVPPTATVPPPSNGTRAGAAASGPQNIRAENGGTPPVVQITKFPSSASPNQQVELRFRAGDADGVIIGWLVQWGDNGESKDLYDGRCGPNSPAGEPDHDFPEVRHTYKEVGTYKVTVTVFSVGTCGLGPTQRATDQRSIEISPLAPVGL